MRLGFWDCWEGFIGIAEYGGGDGSARDDGLSNLESRMDQSSALILIDVEWDTRCEAGRNGGTRDGGWRAYFRLLPEKT